MQAGVESWFVVACCRLILPFDGVTITDHQATRGEQAGRFDYYGERGDDATPDDSPNDRQRYGLPEHHDREALQASAGEIPGHGVTCRDVS